MTTQPDQLALVSARAKKVKAPVPIASDLPVARVLIDSSLPHLDRLFDYAVPEKLADRAQPGVRLRVRFAGKLTDAWLIERAETSDHVGQLAPINQVLGDLSVLRPDVLTLCREVANRTAGTLSDVLRNAVVPRHAKVELEHTVSSRADNPLEVELGQWSHFPNFTNFLEHTLRKSAPRAYAPVAVGDPIELLATYAIKASSAGTVLVVAPDRFDVETITAKLIELGVAKTDIAQLLADDGPAKRYGQFLRVLHDEVRFIVGTRSAVFAPCSELAVIIVFNDVDESLISPTAPYWQAREVAALRSAQDKCALLYIGHSISVETVALSTWCPELAMDKSFVRSNAPIVRSALDADATRRDATAHVRIPKLAMETISKALKTGPVLVHVARAGYLPALTCAKCRLPATCKKCSGPLTKTGQSLSLICSWCAASEISPACPSCGSLEVRAVAIGSERTAEELGRAFPGVPVRSSSGERIVRTIDQRSGIVVATTGAIPRAPKGYAAAILLDANALLARPELRASEKAFAAWRECVMAVASRGDGGQVVIVGDDSAPAVQALIRHDPTGFAQSELKLREQVSLTPAVRMAALTGAQSAIDAVLSALELPAEAVLRGPIPVDDEFRLFICVPRTLGAQLAGRLRQIVAARSAKHEAKINVRIDPVGLL